MSKVVFDGKKPKIETSAFLAPGSWVIGDVTLKERANIWTGAVIRGDDDTVVIGARTTILENCVVEAPTGFPVTIGNDTIISHGAVVHGANIGNRVLVGIGAIILDGAEVGEGSIVGSGALIPPGTKTTANHLILGIPAKPIREVRDPDREMIIREHKRTLSKAERYKEIYSKT